VRLVAAGHRLERIAEKLPPVVSRTSLIRLAGSVNLLWTHQRDDSRIQDVTLATLGSLSKSIADQNSIAILHGHRSVLGKTAIKVGIAIGIRM